MKDMENLKNDLKMIKEIIEVTEYYWQDFIIEYIDNNNKRQRLKDYLDSGFKSKYYFNLLKSFNYKYCHVIRSVPGDEILKFLTQKPLNAKDEDIFLLDEIGPKIFTDTSITRL